MNSPAPASTTTAPVDTPRTAEPPFSGALALTRTGPGDYRADLPKAWTVGGGKLHGGLMLALLTKAALTGLAEHLAAGDGLTGDGLTGDGLTGLARTGTERTGTERIGTERTGTERTGGGSAGALHAPEPVAVSAEFLRAPEIGAAEIGAAELDTEVVKVGRTASVVRASLRQAGRLMLTGTVTAGQLPDTPPSWETLPDLPAEPPRGVGLTSDGPGKVPPMARSCQVVLDPETARFARGERGEPVLRGWVRPRGEEPDVLFALLAGDVLPPLLFNLGRPGWTPTVQLTALLRGRPAPGWLRLEASCRTVRGDWFDEDYTVVDSAGRLICQARQLALAPLPKP